MKQKSRTGGWLRVLPPLVLLAIAGGVGLWSADPGDIASRVSHLFSQDPATAAPQEGDASGACTKPCCAGTETEAPAKACCPNCPVSEKGAVGIVSPAEGGDACCPPSKAASSERDACCPAKGSAALTEPVTTGIAWTKALVQEFKDKGDWCAGHGVPESMCVRCNPALVEVFKAKGDWCKGHDLPESLCTVCNKDLIPLGIGRDWCEKHGLPESQCTLCNPGHAGLVLPSSLLDRARLEVATLEADTVGQEFEAALNGAGSSFDRDKRNGINPDCPLHHMKIRLTSRDVAREADLHVESAGTRRITESLRCYGDVQYDRAHYAVLSPRAPGIVNSVAVNLGGRVSKGDVLATVDSTELGKAKAALLRAQAEVNRWKWMSGSIEGGSAAGAVSRKEIIDAKADLESAEVELAIARQTLLNFGMAGEEIDQTAATKDTSTLLPLRAPFDGTVVDLKAVPGEMASPESGLAAIADLSTMLACLDLHAEDLAQVAVGMPVAFQVDGLKGETFQGKITWISSSIDPKTRTGEVRAELDNSGNLLRAGLFGQGTVAIHADEEVLSVPSEAVQWDGCCNVVFVQQSEDTFEPRKVRLGRESGGYYAIQAGLLPGERVVTQGSYLMKTEVLKSSIGAGCCAEDSAPTSGGTALVQTAH